MKTKAIVYLFVVVVVCGITACSDDDLMIPSELQQDRIECEDNGVMTRAEAIQLVLSHGIGYGYNGVEGEYCNVMDVRSQVLDPEAIRKMGIDFRTAEVLSPQIEYSSQIGYSLHELLQKLYFGGGLNAEAVVVFKGSVRGTLQLYTKSKTSSFYCRTSARISGFNAWVDAPSVSAVVSEHPEVLTKNFRSAIERLGKEPTKIQMDSLIKRYGTHVVTKCQMGGRLDLDIRLEKDSVGTLEQQKAVADVSLLSLYDHSNMSDNDYRDLKIINSGDSRLTVRGGDSKELDFSIFNFKWGESGASLDAIGKWMESIGVTEDKRQNLELVDMVMTPIWEFIPDERVAEMLEAHITGSAELMLDLYGYQNYVNTSFSMPTLNTYQGQVIMENRTKNVYNIMAGGRYVATYCREWVNAIDVHEPVWVAYPIYNQQVNTATGLCIHNGKAYRVGWRFGEYHVEEIGDTDSEMVYTTMGYLYSEPTDGINYLESQSCIGYEWPYSINKDGSLNTGKPIYLPYKQNDDFYLLEMDGTEQTGELGGLPNWGYNGTRMVRNKEYYYYCNLKEVEYVEGNAQVWEYIDLRGLTEDIVITKDVTVSHTTSHKLTVADGVTLTLDNAVINNQIKCEGNAVVVLADGSTNSVTANGVPAIEAGKRGTTLTINGTSRGTLTANSSDAVAIGAANGNSCGSIVVNGGVISATGGMLCAGIGSGSNSSCENISITDGKVTAKGGGMYGSGIGSGVDGSCGSIFISGGTIDATGGYSSSGIGSGWCGSCNNIQIVGGKIKVTGGVVGGSGIGCGESGSCNIIEISGGNIYARGRQGGAGIGSGKKGNCKSIYIHNGVEEVIAVAKETDDTEAIGIGNGGIVYIESEANVKMLKHLELNKLTADVTLSKHFLLSGTTSHAVTVDNANIILENVHINNQLYCLGNVEIRLEDGTNNSIVYSVEKEPGIKIGFQGSLKIRGSTGKLAVQAKGTGIGSGLEEIGGEILIEGGNITVVAESKGYAGIGTGNKAACNDIVISGGIVNVTGGEEAAAIGSGADGACGYICIKGGTVIANGGKKAVGIGSGCRSYCADITITGGNVKATGLDGGAGIGSSSDNSHCGKIIIRNSVEEVIAIVKGNDKIDPIGSGIGGSTNGGVTIDKDANVKTYYE